MRNGTAGVRRIGTYEATCEVDTDGAPVLSEADVGERVDAHSAGVVVVSRNGHGSENGICPRGELGWPNDGSAGERWWWLLDNAAAQTQHRTRCAHRGTSAHMVTLRVVVPHANASHPHKVAGYKTACIDRVVQCIIMREYLQKSYRERTTVGISLHGKMLVEHIQGVRGRKGIQKTKGRVRR